MSEEPLFSGTLPFHARPIWYQAASNASREFAVPDRHSDSGGSAHTRCIEAIFLSIAAVEAFVNELGHYLCTVKVWPEFDESMQLAGHRVRNDLSHLHDLGQKICRLEADRRQLWCKVACFSSGLHGVKLGKGEGSGQQLRLLIEVRNTIVHPKPLDSARVASLRSRHAQRIRQHPHGVGSAWLDDIKTPEMAAWACTVAWDVMYHILVQLDNTLENHPLQPSILIGPGPLEFWNHAKQENLELWHKTTRPGH